MWNRASCFALTIRSACKRLRLLCHIAVLILKVYLTTLDSVFVRKPEGKPTLRRPRSGWGYNIKVSLKAKFFFIFNYALQPFKAYCAIWARRSNFRHQASPRVSPRKSTHRRKVELWTRNVREFCLNADFYVTFRVLLHAVKLRHGTDGFTSPPKESVLIIFSP
jgi:hypothetical protein